MSKTKQKNGEKQVSPAEKPAAPAPVPAVTTPAPVQRTTPLDEAIEQDKATPTTMKIKPDTKGRLEELKTVMKLPDLDAVVGRLIDTLPKRLSTEQEIHLVMPVSKYRWLMAHQDTCDCRNCLNEAKV